VIDLYLQEMNIESVRCAESQGTHSRSMRSALEIHLSALVYISMSLVHISISPLWFIYRCLWFIYRYLRFGLYIDRLFNSDVLASKVVCCRQYVNLP
jgi:hypothetical protein